MSSGAAPVLVALGTIAAVALVVVIGSLEGPSRPAGSTAAATAQASPPTGRVATPAPSSQLAATGIPPLEDGEIPPADGPDYFDEAQMSSGGILAALESCIDSAIKTDPTLAAKPTLLEAYCACTVDAMRKNKGRSSLDITKLAPTWPQLERCGQFGKESAASFAGPTPFEKSAYDNSETLGKLVRGCEKRKADEGANVRWRINYCPCYVDAIRSHKDRPVITPQEQKVCSSIASYVESTRHHLTRRQFLHLAASQQQ
jgi:hypothetical protein